MCYLLEAANASAHALFLVSRHVEHARNLPVRKSNLIDRRTGPVAHHPVVFLCMYVKERDQRDDLQVD